MHILFIIGGLLLLVACEPQKNAAERTEEIETFAEPQIEAYKQAQQVQDVIDTKEAQQQKEMRDTDL